MEVSTKSESIKPDISLSEIDEQEKEKEKEYSKTAYIFSKFAILGLYSIFFLTTLYIMAVLIALIKNTESVNMLSFTPEFLTLMFFGLGIFIYLLWRVIIFFMYLMADMIQKMSDSYNKQYYLILKKTSYDETDTTKTTLFKRYRRSNVMFNQLLIMILQMLAFVMLLVIGFGIIIMYVSEFAFNPTPNISNLSNNVVDLVSATFIPVIFVIIVIAGLMYILSKFEVKNEDEFFKRKVNYQNKKLKSLEKQYPEFISKLQDVKLEN